MKLNRRQLRILIESVIKEDSGIPNMEIPPSYTQEEVDEQVALGVNAHNKVLKDGGYHPQCAAMPALNTPDERIHFFIKCEKGLEQAIINYLVSKEEDLIRFHSNYDAIQHYHSVERPGRIKVEIATFD